MADKFGVSQNVWLSKQPQAADEKQLREKIGKMKFTELELTKKPRKISTNSNPVGKMIDESIASTSSLKKDPESLLENIDLGQTVPIFPPKLTKTSTH
jgi:hypothetical protein